MKTKSGILIMSKREADGLRLMLKHVRQDILKEKDGTFGDGERVNMREANVVADAVIDLEWIIETYE